MQRREREAQRSRRGRGWRRAEGAVGPALHELDGVVAERPEERFGALEGACVVVAIERGRRLFDEICQLGQQRPVERLRDG